MKIKKCTLNFTGTGTASLPPVKEDIQMPTEVSGTLTEVPPQMVRIAFVE